MTSMMAKYNHFVKGANNAAPKLLTRATVGTAVQHCGAKYLTKNKTKQLIIAQTFTPANIFDAKQPIGASIRHSHEPDECWQKFSGNK